MCVFIGGVREDVGRVIATAKACSANIGESVDSVLDALPVRGAGVWDLDLFDWPVWVIDAECTDIQIAGEVVVVDENPDAGGGGCVIAEGVQPDF